ncbi:2-aminoadipate transaminase [soil metagenome]
MVALKRPGEISFGAGASALESFPTAAYSAVTQHILATRAEEAFNFSPTEGHPQLREVIAERNGVRPEEVLVVAGTQQALDLIARCLLCPQDAVVMDWPGFLGAIQTFRLAGAVLAGWDISAADLGELEDLLLKRRPKLLYLNPSFQNPTGHTLPLEVRRGVVELARSYRVPIVEDEVYRDLYFGEPPPPPLFELDGSGLVLHLRTFSKTFAPGLRLGYVIADESIIDQLSLVKAQSDLFCPGLSQLVMAELLSGGVFDNHTRLLRAAHRERALVMDKALREAFPTGALAWQPAEGGLYMWAQLRSGNSRSLLQAASKHGVSFAVGDSFFPDGSGKRALRLCYSSTKPEHITQGINRLASAFFETEAMQNEGLR